MVLTYLLRSHIYVGKLLTLFEHRIGRPHIEITPLNRGGNGWALISDFGATGSMCDVPTPNIISYPIFDQARSMNDKTCLIPSTAYLGSLFIQVLASSGVPTLAFVAPKIKRGILQLENRRRVSRESFHLKDVAKEAHDGTRWCKVDVDIARGTCVAWHGSGMCTVHEALTAVLAKRETSQRSFGTGIRAFRVQQRPKENEMQKENKKRAAPDSN